MGMHYSFPHPLVLGGEQSCFPLLSLPHSSRDLDCPWPAAMLLVELGAGLAVLGPAGVLRSNRARAFDSNRCSLTHRF